MTAVGAQIAPLGLDARASQDTYGAGPQTFPYTSFFQEPWYGGGGGGEVPGTYRRHRFQNFGFVPSYTHETVTITGGDVFCGTRSVHVDGGDFGGGTVWLNITVGSDGALAGHLSGGADGDVSIRLYEISDEVLWDYVSGTMFIPYYN